MPNIHPISWFTNREGQTVKRNGRDFRIPDDAASYCLDLQEAGYVFQDPKPRITVAPDSICTACEG